MTHLLIRTVVDGSTAGYCSCGGWSAESVGTDAASLSAFVGSFKTHKARK